ncbi:hypothetical protein [Gracilibacillus suaedae]|uniref:hypothetical protein n=1 Tax=Gracilibacillus suaedae TaxID=2820273 RepID=UPI001ABDF5DB|nr:hypothetical protein [Gracilibacillus suaedae]
MKNFLLYPFRVAIQEIKKDKERIKISKQSGSNLDLYPFIKMSYMFLLIISIMYIAILYLIIGGIFVYPLAFIALIPTGLTTWIFTLIYTKVFPKTKENYLKRTGFYNNN